MNTETKICQSCKKPFTIEPDDIDFYAKVNVPFPTFCPDCRMRRRLAWRNEHYLYRRKDDKTDEEIFAGFSPSAPVKVYEKDYWMTDDWDVFQYGRDYDFTKPFFEQFRELAYSVPWPSRSIIRLVNSDYCDQAGDLKNCYLCFNSDRLEDSAYIVRSLENKTSFDLTQSNGNELSYEGVSIGNCYKTFFLRDCESCHDVWLSERCIGCTNCFGCANLRNKSYCFFNEQLLSKEEYEKRFAELHLDSWSNLTSAIEKTAKHISSFPVKYFHGIRAVGSTGDYLRNVKNVRQSFFIEDAQDVKYAQNVYANGKDLYDYTVWGGGATLMYECVTCGEANYGLKFSFDCWPSCRNLEYCISCRSSTDCFGCVSLRKKQYCIFNKQYSKEEYHALREKIVHHMSEMPYKSPKGHIYSYGEFLPEDFSPFGYNETMLNDIFPISKERATNEGYSWYGSEAREYRTTMNAADLPNSINDVSDTIINELIQCTSCKKAYRIISSELAFLKKMKVPLPRECVNCRLAKRFAKLNKPKYYHRSCDCRGTGTDHFHGSAVCSNEFETSYSPDKKEIVYCEQCYNAEVA